MLEGRTVMAPLGAFPDDTGEYMLGDVLVTVVLMESDPTLPGADVSTENWTQTAIDAVKSKVQQGMDYWKQTLINTDFYFNADLPLLDFKYDFTWADDPVETQYEPINRYSSYHELWVNDFLNRPDVDFAHTLDIYKDVKAFNNFQREKFHTDWAFTIFVANSTSDTDDFFPVNPSPGPGEVNYRGAFAFLGGQFLVVPSDRPATTFAHEAGHIFYALDEYSTGHSYFQRAGYYNAQNENGARDNPTPNFLGSQQPSMMSTGANQTNAWTNFITSDSSMATIGWRDSDGDGVLDVLDVPFTLKGTGTYDPATGRYKFQGTSSVQTLKNENTFGGQHTGLLYNDISINKIRRAEYSLDGGEWTTVAEYANTTTAALDFTITGISDGAHTLKIRTFDQRTGAASEEFVAEINPANEATPPQLTSFEGGISGFAFRDDNGNGIWDSGEHALSDWEVELRTIDDNLLTLAKVIEPSDYAENTVLNSIQPGVSLSVIGATAGGNLLMARTSVLGAGRVFFAGSTGNETFTTRRDSTGNGLAVDRRLKAEFASPVTTVSLTAISGVVGGGSSVGRLDAYDSQGNLVGRYTTRALAAGQSEVMTITHATADIKYVIASSHLETEVVFDHLVVGPQTATRTGANGSFNLAALPAGTFNLQIVTKPNYLAITPGDGRATVTVTPGSNESNNLYFAFQFGGNPWHNLQAPLNTNGVGGITAFDAIIVINYLNLHPEAPLLDAGEAQVGQYLDVDNNNRVTAFDVIPIINYLNTHIPTASEYEERGGGGGTKVNPIPDPLPETEPPPETDPPSSGSTGGSGGGENSFAQTADQYFSGNPLHVSQRFKDDSHSHLHDDTDLHLHDDADLHLQVEAADHDHFVDLDVDAGQHTGGFDNFFTSLADPANNTDSPADTEEVFTITAIPLTSDLLSLVERLRRLQKSAERDNDQFNPRLAAIRSALGESFDAATATSEQIAHLRLLLKQNFH